MNKYNRLDIRKKLFQSSIWKNVDHLSMGNNLQSPIVVDLDPTTFCNLECPECISQPVLNTKAFSHKRLVDLSFELIEMRVKGVVLIGGGEPLLHPVIGRIIEILSENGIKIGLVTNGTMLHKYIDIISRDVNWVRVSVDAATKETYRNFRHSATIQNNFDTVIRNIEMLTKRTKGAVGFSFLIMVRGVADKNTFLTNIKDIKKAAVLATKLGCDYIEYKAVLDMSHYIRRIKRDFINDIKQQLYQLEDTNKKNTEIILSSSLLNLINNTDTHEEKPYKKCFISELRTTITPNGIFICPYHRGNPKALLGDICNRPFIDVWNKKNRNKIDPSIDCKFHCARHKSNLTILNFQNEIRNQKPVNDYDVFI